MLSIIIPVYNGASELYSLWEGLRGVLERLECSWEVIFVDDGSRDESKKNIINICRNETAVRWVSFAENRGQQAAVLCGLRHCSGDWAVTMDDDLQHPPEFIPELLREVSETGLDALYAVTDSGKRSAGGLLRDGFFSLILGKPAGMRIGSFRIFSRSAVLHICRAGGSFVYISAELFRGDFKVGSVNIPGDLVGNTSGNISRYGIFTRLKLYLRLIIWYTPLISRLTRVHSAGVQYEIAGTGGF